MQGEMRDAVRDLGCRMWDAGMQDAQRDAG